MNNKTFLFSLILLKLFVSTGKYIYIHMRLSYKYFYYFKKNIRIVIINELLANVKSN